ncbi:DNA mismatch repair protein MutS [Rubellimicrobium sp. CFH 75288]|uniref:DNA mismatch repair protein MutS n=1 Tax=Rubellimicrobium sp. CFH 75288 TaxID=2697034 RepID=UPI0014134D14|nr:DNA mismatch repair protein MutS [Rubellimicrobium sp. CFH 75288]NAZ37981.1 DNA mismatch repair protein MutS [Rubellimicrobium sp. CFH 75288]
MADGAGADSEGAGAAGGVTPMMAQYLSLKGAHPDALLFYRMGDFYELFFEDAVRAAEALDIALTRRGQHLGRDVPMCGVPVERAEPYLATLIRKGFRVAVAEQVEDPAEARRRGAKALVRREVVRLVTPGTLTEEGLLEPRTASRLCAWTPLGGLAWADISTGEFAAAPCPAAALPAWLARLGPREVLLAEPDAAGAAGEAVREIGAVATGLPEGAFDARGGGGRICAWFGLATLEGLGAFGRGELAAMGALLDYLDTTGRGVRPALRPPRREDEDGAMGLDAATRASLEILRGREGGRAGSLLACIDRTVTPVGARLLEARLAAPSRRLEEVAARLDAVEALVEDAELRRDLRAALRGAGDPERALGRLVPGRGGPRDLAALRGALRAARAVAERFGPVPGPARLAEAAAALADPDARALHDRLEAALAEEPPADPRAGGAVRTGFCPTLDGLRRLREEGRALIAALQGRYAALTGLGGLKIRHNGTLGYVVEVTPAQAARLREPPHDALFRHRQTIGGAVRFGTDELAATEARLLSAGAEAAEREAEILAALREETLARQAALGRVAGALAEVDVAAALADLAAEEGWTRPRLSTGRGLRIEGGRHPVVEAALRREGRPFVANALDLGERPLLLVTGPNMGGKSTVLRQTGLIAVLAQAGSFVPARLCEMGLVSRLFSRVGASDDIGRGRSTFMVEMVETAAILNRADGESLVLLDEIGRGTATWDGLSIAWAVLEHLEALGCRTLFATHYHELAGLAARLKGAGNAHVAAREWEGELVFLHELREGAADRSWGVQVARLAGLPPRVVARAKGVLRALEARAREGGPRALEDELPLFAGAAPAEAPVPSALEARLRAARPDEMAPREALELLYELKALLGE